MPSARALRRLGDRYAALGLSAAAAAAYRTALVSGEGALAADAAARLAELALANGEGRAARRYADEAQRRAPSPHHRLLLARAQAASGELGGARFAFAAVLDGGGVDARMRAHALFGRADVAAREGDTVGAVAQLLGALDELAAAQAITGPVGLRDDDARLVDEIAARVASLGRSSDALTRVEELAQQRPGLAAFIAFARAGFLAASQAQGSSEPVTDADIERHLEDSLRHEQDNRALKLRLALRLTRRRYRDASARARAIALLEELVDTGRADAEQARVYFLLAALYEDDPNARSQAEEAYRAGLRLRPRHAPAANNLALLALAEGDSVKAQQELAACVRLDPGYDVAWRNVARVIDATRPASALAEDVGLWLDAALPGAGQVARHPAARLIRAAAETATESVLEALHAKGHRLKNLLGIAGARVRSARKAAAGSGALETRLAELEKEFGDLYDEWAAHLRSLQAEGPRLEIVPVNQLVAEVVGAASQDGRPSLRFHPGAQLPDLRGDRALLREALMNLVVNALEAQEAGISREGPVEVETTAVVAAGGAPVVEILIRDRGPGISRADMPRLFAPGFTTKSQGSGIGLAVAHRVVLAHHGRILVDSELTRGTVITVILPSDLGGFQTLAPTTVSRAEL
jgi:signal transduction histidine kinase